MAKRRERRRTLVVDSDTQRRIAAAVVLVPSLGLAVTTAAVALLGYRLLRASLETEVTFEQMLPFLCAVAGFFLVCCAVVGIQGLRFTHRIAGPTYRIRTSLERIRAGDLGFRVTLRRGDYLRELAEEVNRLLDWLNENPPEGARTGGDVIVVDRAGAEPIEEFDLETLIEVRDPVARGSS